METLVTTYYAAKQIFSYERLSDEAKIKARKAVISVEVLAYKKRLKEQTFPIKHLIERRKLFKRYETDIKYCESFIEQNFCEFTEDGTYLIFPTTFKKLFGEV